MGILIALCTLLLLAAVVYVVGAPLRRARAERSGSAPASARAADGDGRSLHRDELEAAREAKYREIRDAELDYRTGKLSEQDYRALDGELRAEALRILDALDALDEPAEPGPEA